MLYFLALMTVTTPPSCSTPINLASVITLTSVITAIITALLATMVFVLVQVIILKCQLYQKVGVWSRPSAGGEEPVVGGGGESVAGSDPTYEIVGPGDWRDNKFELQGNEAYDTHVL